MTLMERLSGDKMTLFNKIAYLCLSCADLEESFHFYHDILGLPVVRKSPGFYCVYVNGVKLGLELDGWRKAGEKTAAENAFFIQFDAPDLDTLERMNQQLEAHSISLIRRSMDVGFGVISTFLDPDGNKLEIVYKTPEQRAQDVIP
jgi:catechol 2,3-dioxygenase-like lactoylglutathione lyase family enzyme